MSDSDNTIKRPSLRKAINDKCKDCNYDKLDRGNWRQQITACTMTDCPLYAVRPVSSSEQPAAADRTPRIPATNVES